MKFYRYAEVVGHNTKFDFWIVVNKTVYNLTPMLCDRSETWNKNLDDLMRYGGKDVSQYFDERFFPILQQPDNVDRPRVVFGPSIETARIGVENEKLPWWSQDMKYKIGRITRVERRVRIMNALANTAHDMVVCDEDTMREIQQMYKDRHNRLAEGYDWRGLVNNVNVKMNMDLTLADNGLFAHGESYATIFLYYTNELMDK